MVTAKRALFLLPLVLLTCSMSAWGQQDGPQLVYAWDEGVLSYGPGNATVYANGGWVSFISPLTWTDSAAPKTLYYIVQNENKQGDTGFLATQNWTLCACDQDGDGVFVPETDFPPLTVPTPMPGIAYTVDPKDQGQSSGGSGYWELVTTITVTTMPSQPYGQICFYAEAKKPYLTGSNLWGPQGRVQSGATKAVNFTFRPANTPTLVVPSSFSALEQDGQVLLQWKTASEFRTAGFRVYRRESQDGPETLVNSVLLPTRPGQQGPGVHNLVDPHALPGRTYYYRLSEIGTDGRERNYGPFAVTPSEPTPDTSSLSLPLLERKHENQPAKAVAPTRSLRLRDSTVRSRSRAEVKLTVQAAGMYGISAEELSAASRMPLAEVRNLIRAQRLHLSNFGQAVPYLAWPGGAGMTFYGQAVDLPYTNSNVYWLKPGPGLKIEQVPSAPTPLTDFTFQESVHIEEDHFALTGLYQDANADYWAWDYVESLRPTIGRKTINFAAPGLTNSGEARLSIKLRGGYDGPALVDHHVVLYLNTTKIGEATWDGTAPLNLDMSLDPLLLKASGNSLELVGELDTGVAYSLFWLDSIDLYYRRSARAVDNRLAVTVSQPGGVTIRDFTTPNISVFDITDPRNPTLVAGTVEQQSESYSVSFTAAQQNARFFAIAGPGIAPECADTEPASTVGEKAGGSDYIVIAPESLAEGAQALVDYRKARGFRATLVRLEHIYDRFAYGMPDPLATKRFLALAYSTWKTKPRYVVLVGAGTYDYKDIEGFGGNMFPPVLVPTAAGLFASDSCLGDVVGDDFIPEIAVGRLPVLDEEELGVLVSKIASYEATLPSQGEPVVLLADKPDDAGDFRADSETLAAILPLGYPTRRIYLSDLGVALARQQLAESITNETYLLNYLGHAGPVQLSQDPVLTVDDLSMLKHTGKLFLFAGMTCLAGKFDLPGLDSIGEELLKVEDGGAIASWVPSGLSENEDAVILNKAWLGALFDESTVVLGDVILKAFSDADLEGRPVRFIYSVQTLLGDPGLRVK